jgi:hypothetical protein
MTKKRKPDNAVSTPYQPTPGERAAAEAYFARKAKTLPAPQMKMTVKGRVTEVAPDHPDLQTAAILLREALGTTSGPFLEGLIEQLSDATSRGGKADIGRLNFALSVIHGVQPRDQLESMLAAQMAAVHMASMTFARRLANVDNIPQQDSAERAFNKLARTYATQLEALKRYRTGGQQKVTVEHVTVNQGGQAIVGNVTHQGGGASPKSEDQPHASEPRSIANAPGTEMPRTVEADRQAVPIASG